jgi:hypothetical protein
MMLNPSTRLRAWLHKDLPKAEPPRVRQRLTANSLWHGEKTASCDLPAW